MTSTSTMKFPTESLWSLQRIFLESSKYLVRLSSILGSHHNSTQGIYFHGCFLPLPRLRKMHNYVYFHNKLTQTNKY